MIDDSLDETVRDAAQSYHEPPEPPREAMWSAIERARAEGRVSPPIPLRSAPRWVAAFASMAAVLVIGIAIGRMSGSAGVKPATSAASARPAASPSDAALPGALSAVTDSATAITERETGTVAARRRAFTTQIEALAAARDRQMRANTSADAAADQGAYRLAVVEHLARTEVLLATFRSQVRASAGVDARVDAHFATLSHELLATTRVLLVTRHGDDPALTRLLQDLELVLMQISQYANDGSRADLDAIEHSMEKHNVMPKLRSAIPAGSSPSSGT